MKEYIVLVQEGEDRAHRWYFTCDADDADHAEEQARCHGADIQCVATFERIK